MPGELIGPTVGGGVIFWAEAKSIKQIKPHNLLPNSIYQTGFTSFANQYDATMQQVGGASSLKNIPKVEKAPEIKTSTIQNVDFLIR